MTRFCMKTFFSIALIIVGGGTSIFAQKGVDTQTHTIKETGDKVTSRPNDASRSFDWGKGKTRVRERLANPYKLNSGGHHEMPS